MSKSMKLRIVFMLVASFAVLAVLTLGNFRVRAETKKQTASVIRLTPPAPVFDEKERLAELAQRRARVAQSIGPKSMLVLFSTEPRVYTNDVDYQYRQENNFFYLTNMFSRRVSIHLTGLASCIEIQPSKASSP